MILDLLADPSQVERFFLVVSEKAIRRRPLPARMPD
jgi:hypothetical protein